MTTRKVWRAAIFTVNGPAKRQPPPSGAPLAAITPVAPSAQQGAYAEVDEAAKHGTADLAGDRPPRARPNGSVVWRRNQTPARDLAHRAA